MTEILIFMWLGDIVSSVNTTLTTVMVVSVIFLFIAIVVYAVQHDQNNAEDADLFLKRYIKAQWFLIPVLLIIMLIPSRDTMRMLVASRATQLAADTQLGQKAISAADAILTRIIKEAGK